MATKAERFRAEAQVENRSRNAKTRPARPRAVKPDKPHNLSEHAARSARVSYEETSSSARPSRKSTRASAHRQRAASQLERKAQLKARAPKTRATQARARAVKTRGKR